MRNRYGLVCVVGNTIERSGQYVTGVSPTHLSHHVSGLHHGAFCAVVSRNNLANTTTSLHACDLSTFMVMRLGLLQIPFETELLDLFCVSRRVPNSPPSKTLALRSYAE
jgi:hypothetical protein